MSIQGFIRSCETQAAEVKADIDDIIECDEGQVIDSHLRGPRDKLRKLNDAIAKAKRKGIPP